MSQTDSQSKERNGDEANILLALRASMTYYDENSFPVAGNSVMHVPTWSGPPAGPQPPLGNCTLDYMLVALAKDRSYQKHKDSRAALAALEEETLP